MATQPPSGFAIHHTAGARCTTQALCDAQMRNIQSFHMVKKNLVATKIESNYFKSLFYLCKNHPTECLGVRKILISVIMCDYNLILQIARMDGLMVVTISVLEIQDKFTKVAGTIDMVHTL